MINPTVYFISIQIKDSLGDHLNLPGDLQIFERILQRLNLYFFLAFVKIFYVVVLLFKKTIKLTYNHINFHHQPGELSFELKQIIC